MYYDYRIAVVSVLCLCHFVLRSRSLRRRGFAATLLSAGALGFLECSILSRSGKVAVL